MKAFKIFIYTIFSGLVLLLGITVKNGITDSNSANKEVEKKKIIFLNAVHWDNDDSLRFPFNCKEFELNINLDSIMECTKSNIHINIDSIMEKVKVMTENININIDSIGKVIENVMETVNIKLDSINLCLDSLQIHLDSLDIDLQTDIGDCDTTFINHNPDNHKRIKIMINKMFDKEKFHKMFEKMDFFNKEGMKKFRDDLKKSMKDMKIEIKKLKQREDNHQE
jgi:hypothetical protein